MYNNGNSSKNVTGSSVVDGTLENADFPDDTISGDKIDGGTISDFASTGIDDNATSTAITIDSSENVSVDTGNLVIGTSGNGIDFSATSGTGTSELLDDYEEGTWTPVLTTNGTDFSSITYDALTGGQYTKIGNMVHVQCLIRTDAVTVGSASGELLISGLPFTSISGGVGRSSLAVGYSVSWAGQEPVNAYVQASDTTIALFYRSTSDGNNAASLYSDVGTGVNNNHIQVAGTYIAA